MDGKIQVTPGYYGLAMCAVYSSLDDVPEIHQKFLRSAQPNSFVLTPAPEFEGDIFYVSQVISSGGVVVSMASHHLRSATTLLRRMLTSQQHVKWQPSLFDRIQTIERDFVATVARRGVRGIIVESESRQLAWEFV